MHTLIKTMALAGLATASTLGLNGEGTTALWTADNGDWQTPENWDTLAVPDATTDVRFNSTTKTPTVSVSSVLDPVRTMFVTGKGVYFNAASGAKMTVSQVITNFNSVTYSGGAYAFGGDLIVGRSNEWPGKIPSYSTTAKFSNHAVAEIAGKIWVTGYSGNGLKVTDGASVTCAGYLDAAGTRNATVIGPNGALCSTGDISVRDCWPNDSFAEPFTVDGGVVTNQGQLLIAASNAGRVPIILRNGAYWRQFGDSRVGGYGSGSADNSLRVLSGSRFESSASIEVSPKSRLGGNHVIVDGGSTLVASNMTFGTANFHTNLWLDITDGSSVALMGSLSIGRSWGSAKQHVSVVGGSTLSTKSLAVGFGGACEELVLAITNSSLTVSDLCALPYDTSDECCTFDVVGTAEHPAAAEFKGGLTIGAGSQRRMSSASTNCYLRTVPTTVLVDNAVVASGTVDASGTASGDTRLGALHVGGVTDLATNRLIIAGERGCFVARHRMMTAGTPEIELRVPKGGYQNEYGSALHVNHAYLASASILVDLSQVEADTKWREYQLADSTSSDLNIDVSRVRIVSPKKCRYEIVSTKQKLSVKVKFSSGLGLLMIMR